MSVVLACAVFIFPSLARAFTDATQGPPNGNVSGALNTGDTPQTKTGGLTVGAFKSADLTVTSLANCLVGNLQFDANGKVTCPTPPPAPTSSAQCGPATTITTSNPPSVGLCQTGTASLVTDAGTSWKWTCTDAQLLSVNCSAPRPSSPNTGKAFWQNPTHITGAYACFQSGYSSCTQSFDSGGATQACSALSYGGSAACSGALSGEAFWQNPTHITGAYACFQSGYSSCTQSFDSGGATQTCEALSYGGSAACSDPMSNAGGGGNTLGLDVKWGPSNYSTGTYQCMNAGYASCTTAYDNAYATTNCSTAMFQGSAVCSGTLGVNTKWGPNNYSTGTYQCMNAGYASCTTAYDNAYATTNCSTAMFQGSAVCSGTLGVNVAWGPNSYSTGTYQCMNSGYASCTTAYDNAYATTNCSTAMFQGYAVCQ